MARASSLGSFFFRKFLTGTLTGSKALGSGEGRLWYFLMISLILLVGSGLGDVGSGGSGSGLGSLMLGGTGSGFTSVFTGGGDLGWVTGGVAYISGLATFGAGFGRASIF